MPVDEAIRDVAAATRAALKHPTDPQGLGLLVVRELGLRQTPKYDTAKLTSPDGVKLDIVQSVLLGIEAIAPSLPRQLAPDLRHDARAAAPPPVETTCGDFAKAPPIKKWVNFGQWLRNFIPGNDWLDIPVEVAQADFLAHIVSVTLDADHSVQKGHYGPEGHARLPGPKSFLRFNAQVQADWHMDRTISDQIVEEGVACGSLADMKVTLPKQGPIEGAEVMWDPGALLDHGRVSHQDPDTDAKGEAIIVFQLKDEESPDEGALVVKTGELPATANYIGIFGNKLGPLVGDLKGRGSQFFWAVGYHICEDKLPPPSASGASDVFQNSCFPRQCEFLKASFSVHTTAKKTKGTGICDQVGGTAGSVDFVGNLRRKATDTGTIDRSADGSLLGDMFVNVPARWTNIKLDGCRDDAEGKVSECHTTLPDVVPTGGKWKIGFHANGPVGGPLGLT